MTLKINTKNKFGMFAGEHTYEVKSIKYELDAIFNEPTLIITMLGTKFAISVRDIITMEVK